MKNIFIVLFLIFLSSCITESRMYQRQYLIKNETSKNIRLKFYLTFTSDQLVEEIFILNDEIFEGEIIEFDQPHSTNEDYLINTAFKGSDSLVIIFNNNKRIVNSVDFNGIFSAPINRNFFRFGNYENLGNDDFQFTITQEDYNNAEDCNGNCD